jgi:biopolymer transport protein ExbD
MRFAHNTRVFRGQLEVAPFASVFFLLLIFVVLQSAFVFTPGIPIRLPVASDLPGVSGPTLSVAVDGSGVIYFDNQATSPDKLREKLKASVGRNQDPVTLIIQADKSVNADTLVQLSLLARDAGMNNAILATRPQVTPLPMTDNTP